MPLSIDRLPFPKREYKIESYQLPDDLILSTEHNAYKVPKGTVIRLMTSRNFGVVSTAGLNHLNLPKSLWRY